MNKKLLLLLSVVLLLFLALGFFYWTTVKFSKPVEALQGVPVTVATPAELQHSLILYRDSVLVQANHRQASLEYESVGAYLARHRAELSRLPLNIVQTGEVRYQSVVDVLEQVTTHHIRQYKLLQYPE